MTWSEFMAIVEKTVIRANLYARNDCLLWHDLFTMEYRHEIVNDEPHTRFFIFAYDPEKDMAMNLLIELDYPSDVDTPNLKDRILSYLTDYANAVAGPIDVAHECLANIAKEFNEQLTHDSIVWAGDVMRKLYEQIGFPEENIPADTIKGGFLSMPAKFNNAFDLTFDDYSPFYGSERAMEDKIKDVIFNDPATIVLWKDGTKTVVKCGPDDEYDPEKGLALCMLKKQCGNKGNYNNLFRKYLPKKEKPFFVRADGFIDVSVDLHKDINIPENPDFSHDVEACLEKAFKTFKGEMERRAADEQCTTQES